MADGEKKRFGNFAEYAKARQAGKVGSSDTFQISSQDQVIVLSRLDSSHHRESIGSVPQASQSWKTIGCILIDRLLIWHFLLTVVVS
mmetsp:Transcript_7760/g.16641  ORF Transcript_7760/g.16641 Transcript_7760/m.16641 type:complete len:87 (-) Transcript_7760:305-565(-)